MEMGRMKVGLPYCCRWRKFLVLEGRQRDSERASGRRELSELLEGLQSCMAQTQGKAVVCISSLRGGGHRYCS